MARKETTATSFRITNEAIRLLKLLADNMGVSQSAVVEIAVRSLAEEKGLRIKQEE